MKLVKLYFIGVVIAISGLAASLFWQYQQFQTNVGSISFKLPSELSNNMPNLTEEYGKILNQAQSQQGQTQASPATSTKEYQAPDGVLKFEYPADWQETTNQTANDANSKVLITLYKTAASLNYLIVEESNATSAIDVISQYKENSRAKGIPVKITESEIISGQQTISAIKLEYNTVEPTLGMAVNFAVNNAVIPANGKIYIISIMMQSDNTAQQEVDRMFNSIAITDISTPIQNEPESETTK